MDVYRGQISATGIRTAPELVAEGLWCAGVHPYDGEADLLGRDNLIRSEYETFTQAAFTFHKDDQIEVNEIRYRIADILLWPGSTPDTTYVQLRLSSS